MGGQVRSEDRGVSGSGTRVRECEPFRVKAVVGKELKCVSEKGRQAEPQWRPRPGRRL